MSTFWKDHIQLYGTEFHDRIIVTSLAFECLFGFLIVLAAVRQSHLEGGQVGEGRPNLYALRRIKLATRCAIIYYILLIIDLCLSEKETVVTNLYVIMGFLIKAFKILSEILITLVFYRIFRCQYEYIEVRNVILRTWRSINLLLTMTVCAIGVYVVLLEFAINTVYLIQIDSPTELLLVGKQTKIEGAYTLLYFCLAMSSCASAAYYMSKRSIWNAGQGMGKVDLYLIVGSVFLLIRSISSTVIYVRYALKDYAPPPYLPAANSFVYGLCTYCLLFALTAIGNPFSDLEEGRELLRHGQFRVYKEVTSQLKTAVHEGRPLPSMADIVRGILAHPTAMLPIRATSRIASWSEENLRLLIRAHISFVVGFAGLDDDLTR